MIADNYKQTSQRRSVCSNSTIILKVKSLFEVENPKFWMGVSFDLSLTSKVLNN